MVEATNEIQSPVIPTPKQWEFLSAEEMYPLYGGAVGGGKTVAECYAAYLQSVLIPGNVGYMCRYQLADFRRSVLPTLLDVVPPQLILAHNKSERYIDIQPQGENAKPSRIWYGGLREEMEEFGSSRGYRESPIKSMTLGWAAIDQVEECSKVGFNWLASRLRLKVPGVMYKIYMTANPQPGWVRDDFIEKPKTKNHKFIPALCTDNPHLPEDYEERLTELYTPEMVARLLRGDWDIDTSLNNLFMNDWIVEAVNRELKPEDSLGVRIAGVDVARYGKDRTVYTLRQGNKVLDIEHWAKQDTTYSASHIARRMDDDGVHHVNVDSIGIGAGVIDPLKKHGYNVKEINVGTKALHNDVFANKRAELFNKLMESFRDELISIPDHPELQSDLASIRYTYDHKNRLILLSKEDHVRRGHRSPDFADSLMLAFADGLKLKEGSNRKARVSYYGIGARSNGKEIEGFDIRRRGLDRARY